MWDYASVFHASAWSSQAGRVAQAHGTDPYPWTTPGLHQQTCATLLYKAFCALTYLYFLYISSLDLYTA
ncbi:hypothetical protein PSENEW3_00004589 [Picochlorum sp. SENEW3]|nr:hypothetical protein PSENEW3_00004589 [Picochlorum sp. SENEW3]